MSQVDEACRKIDVVWELRQMYCIGLPESQCPCDMKHPCSCVVYGLAIDEINRLRKIEAAAKKLSDSIDGGFVVCGKCGDQESLTDIDFAADLRAALNLTK